eukprot:1155229-Pelagomonas_calceolata.AAC.2
MQRNGASYWVRRLKFTSWLVPEIFIRGNRSGQLNDRKIMSTWLFKVALLWCRSKVCFGQRGRTYRGACPQAQVGRMCQDSAVHLG